MVIIGEKINATRSEARAILEEHDAKGLVALAKAQADAGADFIDVNVGTGAGSREDEVRLMQWAVETLQSETDVSLCIDSADPEVLEAGLAAREGRPSLINSAKASEDLLDAVLTLAKNFEAPLVALAMDEHGIPNTAEERIRICTKIASACEKHGVPLGSVYFDPLVLPVSTDVNQGLTTLETLKRIKETIPEAKTVMGLSNISFGLPDRPVLNAAFLNMAVYAGLDAAIMDPLEPHLAKAVKTAEVLAGRDKRCRRYLRAFRGRA